MTFEPVVENVYGYRVFRVGGGALHAVSNGYKWVPGWNTAACSRGKRHPAPAFDCECGFWVYRTVEKALGQFDDYLGVTVNDDNGYGDFTGPTGAVLAKVQLAGNVIQGRDGWRAEHAGVIEFYCDQPELIIFISMNYGAPVSPLADIVPIEGILAEVSDEMVRVLLLEGPRKWQLEPLLVDRGSAVHLTAMALADADAWVRVHHERRGIEKWATSIEKVENSA